MLRRWRVVFGNRFGAYRAEGKIGWRLKQPTWLREAPDGTLEMVGIYDPPGSGGLAILASIATVIVVLLVAQAVGFAAGPGWLLWYWLIRAIRRENVTLDLSDAKDVLLDDKSKRMAIPIDFKGRSRWMVFAIKENYDDAAAFIRSTYGIRVRDGIVDDPSKIPSFVFLGLVFAILAAFVALFVAMAMLWR